MEVLTIDESLSGITTVIVIGVVLIIILVVMKDVYLHYDPYWFTKQIGIYRGIRNTSARQFFPIAEVFMNSKLWVLSPNSHMKERAGCLRRMSHTLVSSGAESVYESVTEEKSESTVFWSPDQYVSTDNNEDCSRTRSLPTTLDTEQPLWPEGNESQEMYRGMEPSLCYSENYQVGGEEQIISVGILQHERLSKMPQEDWLSRVEEPEYENWNSSTETLVNRPPNYQENRGEGANISEGRKITVTKEIVHDRNGMPDSSNLSERLFPEDESEDASAAWHYRFGYRNPPAHANESVVLPTKYDLNIVELSPPAPQRSGKRAIGYVRSIRISSVEDNRRSSRRWKREGDVYSMIAAAGETGSWWREGVLNIGRTRTLSCEITHEEISPRKRTVASAMINPSDHWSSSSLTYSSSARPTEKTSGTQEGEPSSSSWAQPPGSDMDIGGNTDTKTAVSADKNPLASLSARRITPAPPSNNDFERELRKLLEILKSRLDEEPSVSPITETEGGTTNCTSFTCPGA